MPCGAPHASATRQRPSFARTVCGNEIPLIQPFIGCFEFFEDWENIYPPGTENAPDLGLAVCE